MPTRRISDDVSWQAKTCLDPDHNISAMQYFPTGKYEHECPSCHHIFTFTVHPDGGMDHR